MQAMVGSVLIFLFFPFFFSFLGLLGIQSVLPWLAVLKLGQSALQSLSFLRVWGNLWGVFPHLESFISKGNSLGVVVADLLPLLR